MKYVKILGGLGNQMFQYAFAEELSQKHKVVLDVSFFKLRRLRFLGGKFQSLHNGFELEKLFDIRLKTINRTNIYGFFSNRHGKKIFKKKIIIESSEKSVSTVIGKVKSARYFDGYWQNEEYFKSVRDDMQKIFEFQTDGMCDRNKEMLSRIINSDSVGVHVRRGDYVNHPLYSGICTDEYYKKCIDIVGTSNKSYFIFSNDIEYCKKKFDLPNVTYIDYNAGDESYWDMVLMSYCKTLIIANSSFSWWGAWLNPLKSEKKIYCPSKWLNDEKVLGAVTPKSWTKVKV